MAQKQKNRTLSFIKAYKAMKNAIKINMMMIEPILDFIN